MLEDGRQTVKGKPRRRRPSAQTVRVEVHLIAPEAADAQAARPVLAEPPTELALSESERLRIERREQRVAGLEATSRERALELDDREAAIDLREAELEAAFELREDALVRREIELAELERRLVRKENELAAYVGHVQDELATRGSSEWWSTLRR